MVSQMQLEQDTRPEREKIDLLAALTSVNEDTIRLVLRKYRGDVDKAANALLNGDVGVEETREPRHRTTPEPSYHDAMRTNTPIPTSLQNTSTVIDLTGDEDDDLRQAMAMSMEEPVPIRRPRFERTERAPHPEWQMVRSNEPVASGPTQEEQSLNEAIQASLQDLNDDADLRPYKESVREGNRPIALRPEKPSLAYAALTLQALYFIPQVRAAVSNLRLPDVDSDAPMSSPDRAMVNLIELFTNMDLAQLSALVDTEVLPSLGAEPLNEHTTSVNDIAGQLTKIVSDLIEQHLNAQSQHDDHEPERLFSFSHGSIIVRRGLLTAPDAHEGGGVVHIPIPSDTPNDLISCLSKLLTNEDNGNASYDVIVDPSEVFVFSLKRDSMSRASSDPFNYPKTIFLDRFLAANFATTTECRETQAKLEEDIKELTAYKATLTRFNNRDTLQDLRSTIHYYEHIADDGGSPERQQMLQRTVAHLNDVMTVILGKVEDIDHKLGVLQEQLNNVWDIPELQLLRYDLRAVLVHSGLPGRNHIYSYVQDIEGIWWKTVDHTVTEVLEETVLNDPAGLHLHAGPFMMFYSRHLTEQELHEPVVWPSIFSEVVADNNRKFLAMIHPELEMFSRVTPERELSEPSPVIPAYTPSSDGRLPVPSRANSRMTVDTPPR